MMFMTGFLVACMANLMLVSSSNVTLGTIQGYLPGVNDVFRMFKPGLIEILWNTPHVSSGVEIANSYHDLFQVDNFDYYDTEATLEPDGYYGYLNVSGLYFAYNYSYTTIYTSNGICQGYLAPEVGIEWVLLKYRLRINEPCSIQIESLPPLMGSSELIDLRAQDLSGSCSTNTLNEWGQSFLSVVDAKILEQMPLIVDSFLANEAYYWLPGWRKIVSPNPFYVLRFFPCLPSFEMTTQDVTLGVSVEWNSTVDVEKKEFHMQKEKKSAKSIIQESEIYLCVLLGIFIGLGSVIGGDKYIRRKKEMQI